MSNVLTNELEIKFDFGKINQEFVVCEFSTSQKYIKFNAKILDEKMKTLGIVHENGRLFYALYTLKTFDKVTIIDILRKTCEGADFTIKVISPQDIPKHLLLQLFMNATPNPKDGYFSFNNLTGKLYCVNTQKVMRSKSGIIFEIPSLEIKANSRLELELNVRTFTSMALKKQMGGVKTSEMQRYKLFNGNLVRIIDETVESTEQYILRTTGSKKSTFDFIDFTDHKKFTHSKCGMLYEFLKRFREKFEKFVLLDFKNAIDVNTMKFATGTNKEKNENILQFIHDYKFAIIDEIQDSTSKMFIGKLIASFKKLYPTILLEESLSPAAIYQNLILIHNKEYYIDGEDKYKKQTSFLTQYITLEDFCSDVKACISNIVKELYIKQDLKRGRVTLLNWNSFNLDGTWVFARNLRTSLFL